MADIRPFRAVRYNQEKIEDLCDVTTPPYDVIDARFQQALYDRDPHNFIRLDLGKIFESDDASDNRYTRAAKLYEQWREDDVLIREDKPSFYVYKQSFEADGQTIERTGFMGIVRVHDYDDRVILPHERTHKGPKVDRLELMKATQTQLSQLFLLYNDESRSVDETLASQCDRTPEMDVTCDKEVRHQIWAVDDAQTIASVVQALQDEQLLIADGHHRYETAVAFRDLEPSTGDNDRPRDFAMVYLANAADPGLQVWPTHRTIHSLNSFDFDQWLETIQPYFSIQKLASETVEAAYQRLSELSDNDNPAYVVLREDDNELSAYLIQLDPEAARQKLEELDVVDAARTLDVTVLHDFVLAQLMDISLEVQEAKTNIKYPRSLADAEEQARMDKTHMVFLMNPTPIQQIRKVCTSGGFMPQKSTYFYPKVLSGLVINDLHSF